MSLAIPPALIAVLVLVVGALLILTFPTRLAGSPSVLATIGTLTLVAAALPVTGGDALTRVSVLAVLAAAVIAMLLVPSAELHEASQRPEVAALILLGSTGAIVMATANELLSAALGLETLSLSAAVLVALGRGERPLEAAFRYFVLAAISFAALIYGLGLLLLATGSFGWPTSTAVDPAFRWIWVLGVLLVGLGFGYKLAAFPLQWGPLDAYTAGAPALSGYVMAASKIAAVVALARLVAGAALPMAPILIGIGLVSIAWGTFGALAQREVRRMLAYSTVANAGLMALALGCGAEGRAAAIFFVAIYALTVLLAFAAIAGRGTGPLPFGEVRAEGLSATRALGLALALLSLAGIPPTPGFWAKLAILDASWSALGIWPTLVAVIGGVAGVLYYLRPLPDLLAVARAGIRATPAPAVWLAGAAVVVLGLAPGLAYALARLAVGG